MTLSSMGLLAGLALVDSTSFGTLGIPVLLLLRRHVHVTTLVLYLATIGAFYWAIGLGLTLGAGFVARAVAGLGDLPALTWAQLVVGVALFAASFLVDGTRARRARARRAAAGAGPTRRERWTASLVDDRPRPGVVVGVALAAGLVEVASMLPFLGAAGLIAQAGLTAPQTAGVLVAYVVVMTLPALVLLALRLTAGPLVEPTLARLGRWLERNAEDLLGWVLGIAGFFLAADAVSRLAIS